MTMLYFTSLPGVTIILHVHHHTVLSVSARGHNPSRRTSPYLTIRLWPGSQVFYKYITMLYYTSLPGVTIPLQVHHHTVLYVSGRGHNNSTSTSPCCSIRLCPGSQAFYKFIIILYFTSLPGFTILLQVHHHTVLYLSARGRNPSTTTSPYCTLRLCPGSQSFYKYITMLYFTSLPGVTIPLQIHHHTVLYLSARGHNPSTSTSPCFTIVSAQGHNHSTSTSPLFTIRLCLGSQPLYKYITILYFTPPSGLTFLLQVHHHASF